MKQRSGSKAALRRAARLGVLLVAGLVGVWAVACGGDGDGGNGMTPPPEEPEVGTIAGSVETDAGDPVPGAQVEASMSGATSRSATTGSDGSFEFTEVETGTWQLDMTPPDGFEVDPGQSLPASVTVSADQTSSVTLLARQERGAVAGTVVDDTGEPISGATMTLVFPDGSSETTDTGSDGTYMFGGLDAGEYTVSVNPPAGFQVPEDQTGEQVVTVELGATATADFTVEPEAGTGTVSGAVENGSMPISGATVTLTGGGASQTAQTGNDGSFRFRALEPGDYTLSVEVPDGVALATGESEEKDVSVMEDQETTAGFQVVHVVELTGSNTFSPSSLTVQTGSTVRWVNTSNVFHTVTPDGHSEWARAETQQPETVLEVTFDTAGTFEYFCEPHRAVGMEGEIIVQ